MAPLGMARTMTDLVDNCVLFVNGLTPRKDECKDTPAENHTFPKHVFFRGLEFSHWSLCVRFKLHTNLAIFGILCNLGVGGGCLSSL